MIPWHGSYHIGHLKILQYVLHRVVCASVHVQEELSPIQTHGPYLKQLVQLCICTLCINYEIFDVKCCLYNCAVIILKFAQHGFTRVMGPTDADEMNHDMTKPTK